MASIHSSVSTSLVVRSQSTAGTRKSGSSLVFSAISESAAASSRKSISIMTERRNVSTTSTSRSRRASAERFSACCAAKVKAARSAWKRRSTPGRSTLTATARGSAAVATVARCTCAIEAAATGGPKLAKTAATGLPNDAATAASASACGNGGIWSCRRSRSRAKRDADHVRPRRQELAELHVARPEPRQRRRQPRLRGAARGRSISRAMRSSGRAGTGTIAGSTTPNTPSRANTKPARPSRTRCAGAGNHKRQPECSATMPPVIGWNETRAKPAARIMAAKACGLGKRRIDSTR